MSVKTDDEGGPRIGGDKQFVVVFILTITNVGDLDANLGYSYVLVP